ncbi:MAG TPA: FkbM family methyltransferase [Thermoanaerobaculia bacterium]|nr:FkbM family methyltransferase [Thermoanaerobaculia bacterium]
MTGQALLGSAARRAKDVARVLLGRADPFRRRQRDAIDVAAPYHSQYGQDRVIDGELFGGRRGGVFVDIGAHDGVSFNNTAYFERALGWRGLCVEPIPEVFAELQANRSAVCVRACIGRSKGTREFVRATGYAEMLSGIADTYDPRHLERIRKEVSESGGTMTSIEVACERLDALLGEHGFASVDLLSVDVEGAELEVLDSFDLRRLRPSVVCIENNYRDRAIWRAMARAGYRPYTRIRQDEIYLARGFRPVAPQ